MKMEMTNKHVVLNLQTRQQLIYLLLIQIHSFEECRTKDTRPNRHQAICARVNKRHHIFCHRGQKTPDNFATVDRRHQTILPPWTEDTIIRKLIRRHHIYRKVFCYNILFHLSINSTKTTFLIKSYVRKLRVVVVCAIKVLMTS